MAVLGFLEWWRQLRACRFPAADDPPGSPAGSAAPPEAGPLIEEAHLVEEAHSPGEVGTGPPTTRLLLGTTCGSALLLSIAVSARMAPGLGPATLTPLTETVLAALGAAVVTALAARAGRVLRGRSGAAREPGVSGSPSPVDEPSPQPGRERPERREHGDVP
ncbi:hypothetical protein [Streptomyces gibsoniae]|uniref:Uncharacterized protein n=1 Tax=Streptomyces gibsoniae TaxID=3075529 RepID=A0ABU2U0C8_9ACTN|nr:hypothetical protein [Streptomyces sp. DSM 41699]MDT0466684.1 hypothetical protein [Streptomyces sp. DSM 41699]